MSAPDRQFFFNLMHDEEAGWIDIEVRRHKCHHDTASGKQFHNTGKHRPSGTSKSLHREAGHIQKSQHPEDGSAISEEVCCRIQNLCFPGRQENKAQKSAKENKTCSAHYAVDHSDHAADSVAFANSVHIPCPVILAAEGGCAGCNRVKGAHRKHTDAHPRRSPIAARQCRIHPVQC